MKKIWKGDLNVGDTVILYHMEGESGIPIGTKGTVVGVNRDPFGKPEDKLYDMKWESGSRLSLSSAVDSWKKIVLDDSDQEISESNEKTGNVHFDTYERNQKILKNFDWKFILKFMKLIQKSGIINMFESPPLLYSGPEYIKRYYGENLEDDADFNEMIEMAQEAKDKMIQGTISYLESNGKEVTLESVNSIIRQLSKKMFDIYVNYYGKV